MWFNPPTMSASAPAPPAAAKPEEAKSHAVTMAALPTRLTRTACVANFKDAAKAERAAAELRALGLPDDEVRTLTNLEQRRELLDGYRHDRPSMHTQAGVGAAIFGAVGAVMLSLGALILIPDPPAMQWFFIVAFTVGILGACLGGFLGWWALRPADDPQDPLNEQVAQAGPAVAVLEGDYVGPNGEEIPLSRVARTLIRCGGSCQFLSGPGKADAHPGDTRGGDFKDSSFDAAPEGRPTAAAAH